MDGEKVQEKIENISMEGEQNLSQKNNGKNTNVTKKDVLPKKFLVEILQNSLRDCIEAGIKIRFIEFANGNLGIFFDDLKYENENLVLKDEVHEK